SLRTEAPDLNFLVQDGQMTEEQRENFLSAFKEVEQDDERVIGMAVLGGIFSEGIDLKGDRLQGVIVVGVGLPQVNLERNIIKDYFQSIGHNGFDYSYVYPGMNK
ncbi:helicase C-terminal domain-containing protein, partial [Agrococcus sp. HG114]|uniref:helicase C-terminal domain-containing protein n=1 Tax=Agrococcus sp. HG114 TaxID=2969757 RepID=UPI00215A2B15